MEEREWLKAQLKEIEKWEKDQQKVWFWEKLSRLPFQMLDKLTPAFIQKKSVCYLMKWVITFNLAVPI